MSIKAIRLQEPNPPLSSEGDFGADRYRPSVDWNASTGDVPIVAKAFNTTGSDVTKQVRRIDDNNVYTIPTNNAWNCSFYHEDRFWDWNPTSGFRVEGNTNSKSFIIGHKGVKSAGSANQSWQRGVIGISMKYWRQPPSGYYGQYIYDMTLLYRKWSDDSQFYGVDLIKGGNLENNCRQNYTSTSPFKTSSPQRGDSEGTFFACMRDDHPAYNTIAEQKLVLQGIYFKWESYDAATQFTGKFHLWNPRLLFDSSSYGDRGSRICMPRLWDFSVACTSPVMRLASA